MDDIPSGKSVMGKGLGLVNFPRLFVLLVLVFSLAFILIYVSSYCLALSSSLHERVSETVYGEDMVIIFSSLKRSYIPGERAIFYIDVLNIREFPIFRVNFSLNVKASSLFGLDVYSTEGYSTRAFMPGKFERMQTLSKDAVEVSLPAFLPPGFYTLELSAKPQILKSPPKVALVIYVEPSTSAIAAPLTTLVFSGTLYIMLTLGARVDAGKLSKNPAARKLALFSYSINIKSQEVAMALKRTFINFSIGQKFVFLGICFLITATLPLILRFEGPANDLAILAYFSLMIGVINLLWESSKPRIINLQLHPSVRLMLSLINLGLLTYLSNKILGTMILVFTLYIAIRTNKYLRKHPPTKDVSSHR